MLSGMGFFDPSESASYGLKTLREDRSAILVKYKAFQAGPYYGG